MLKRIYYKYPYFFNLAAVLVLLIITRMLDWFAWTAPSPDKTNKILFSHLFEFISFLPMVFLIIFSYRWAIERKMTFLLIRVCR